MGWWIGRARARVHAMQLVPGNVQARVTEKFPKAEVPEVSVECSVWRAEATGDRAGAEVRTRVMRGGVAAAAAAGGRVTFVGAKPTRPRLGASAAMMPSASGSAASLLGASERNAARPLPPAARVSRRPPALRSSQYDRNDPNAMAHAVLEAERASQYDSPQ